MAVRYGDLGRALSPMSPSGAVEVCGERVDARSERGFIEAGSEVMILRGDPTGYVVRKLDPGRPPPHLSNHGKPIPKAEFQRNATEVAEAELHERAETRRRLLKGLRYGSMVGAALGAIVGLIGGVAGWHFGWAGVAESNDAVVLLGMTSAAGAAAGLVLIYVTVLVGTVTGFTRSRDEIS